MVSASTRLLEGKVDRLSDISGQTLSQVGGIVGRFDEHSKVLTQASTASRRCAVEPGLDARRTRRRAAEPVRRPCPAFRRDRKDDARARRAWSRPPSSAPSNAPTRSPAICARACSPPSPMSAACSRRPRSGPRKPPLRCAAPSSRPAKRPTLTIDGTFGNAERRFERTVQPPSRRPHGIALRGRAHARRGGPRLRRRRPATPRIAPRGRRRSDWPLLRRHRGNSPLGRRHPQGTRHDAQRAEARRLRPSGRSQGKRGRDAPCRCRADQGSAGYLADRRPLRAAA